MMEIRKFDDPALRVKCKPVRKINSGIKALVKSMAETMYESEGVGLAAPQVGDDRRIVVLDTGDGLWELINPEIVDERGAVEDVEGCLSLPGILGRVTRPEWVQVKALDIRGNTHWVEGEGLLARALCHEIDHLDGVLFIDRAESVFFADDEDDIEDGEAGVGEGD